MEFDPFSIRPGEYAADCSAWQGHFPGGSQHGGWFPIDREIATRL